MDLTQQAKDQAVNLLTAKLQNIVISGQDAIFFMSGGTWVDIMNQIDIQALDMDRLASLLTLTCLDDRLTTGAENNFQKISESSTFVSTLIKKGAAAISTTPSSADLSVSEFGDILNQQITAWFVAHPAGYALATVGVGGLDNVEGHTAGIAPSADVDTFNKLFVSTDRLYAGYDSTLTPSKRVTATFKLLAMLDKIVLILGAPKKAHALKLTLEGTAPWNEFPAAFLGTDKSKTQIITDIILE